MKTNTVNVWPRANEVEKHVLTCGCGWDDEAWPRDVITHAQFHLDREHCRAGSIKRIPAAK